MGSAFEALEGKVQRCVEAPERRKKRDKAKSKPAEFKELLKRSGDHATSLRDMLAAGTVDVKKASALLAAIGDVAHPSWRASSVAESAQAIVRDQVRVR